MILGPCRSETQVEISVTDARRLGIKSVIRQSGDLEGTPGCTLIGPKGKIELSKGVIVAKRHIHMTPVDAIRAHVKDNDIVFVITTSYERSLIFSDVVVRVSPSYSLAMHVDTDEANAICPMRIIYRCHPEAVRRAHLQSAGMGGRTPGRNPPIKMHGGNKNVFFLKRSRTPRSGCSNYTRRNKNE